MLLLLLVSCTVQDEMTIGALLPLSGPNAVYGIEIQNAIELARNEINAAGGINGQQLKIRYEDDQASPVVGVNAMQKLLTVDNVHVVLGSWSSGVVLATAPITEQQNVLVMASAIAPAISDAGDYVFRIQPSAHAYTALSAALTYKTAAILHANTEFATALKDAFLQDFQGIVVAVEVYEEQDRDVRTQLTRIKEEMPELLFIAGYQDTITVITQAHELGITAQLLAGPPFESAATLAALGDLAEGVLYPYHFVPGEARSRNYERAYYEQYGTPTGGFAPLMYDATHIIAHTLRACQHNTTCMVHALHEIRYEGVSGTITFDENGDPSIPLVMKTVRDGVFVRA